MGNIQNKPKQPKYRLFYFDINATLCVIDLKKNKKDKFIYGKDIHFNNVVDLIDAIKRGNASDNCVIRRNVRGKGKIIPIYSVEITFRDEIQPSIFCRLATIPEIRRGDGSKSISKYLTRSYFLKEFMLDSNIDDKHLVFDLKITTLEHHVKEERKNKGIKPVFK